MPKFELEDIEDYYTYYVLIMGVSEDIFWHAELNTVESIVANKIAYDNWLNYQKEKSIEERR